jgi:hypothetical protein
MKLRMLLIPTVIMASLLFSNAYTSDFPLSLKSVKAPSKGVWVGKRFNLTLDFDGPKQALKSIGYIQISMEPLELDTDLEIGDLKKLGFKQKVKPSDRFTFRNLKIRDFAIDGKWKLEIQVFKGGLEGIDDTEIEDYVLYAGTEIIEVQTAMPVDIEGPKLDSFNIEREGMLVKISASFSDPNGVVEPGVLVMQYKPNGNGTGCFYHMTKNKETGLWEITFDLTNLQRLEVSDSISVSDELRNHEIIVHDQAQTLFNEEAQ